MKSKYQKTIHSLNSGEFAKVKSIVGGKHFVSKMESLGIREGVQIIKISSQIMGGPIIVKVGQAQIAIGRKMAKYIVTE